MGRRRIVEVHEYFLILQSYLYLGITRNTNNCVFPWYGHVHAILEGTYPTLFPQ